MTKREAWSSPWGCLIIWLREFPNGKSWRSMRFTTLIVDDEPLAREGLRMWLASDGDVSAIQEAKDGREAVAAIRNNPPDLVFLDVQMPEMDGFSVVHQVGADRMPAVVFVTAHDQHAIQAFEINAIDYLLKPVTEERFTQALARAKIRLQSHSSSDANRQIIGLLETIVSPRRHMKRLAVRSAGKTVFVEPAAAMQWTHTESLASRPYRKLSGGQKRQVQFALVICGRPKLLFLDGTH